MSKRQEIRERRRREQIRNRIIGIVAVVVVALLIAFLLIVPSIRTATTAAKATKSAENATPVPVVTITPRVFNAKVDAYEDFRCSACLAYSKTVEPQIIQDYVETGKIYYTFHSYIVIDQDGTDASYRSANAAMCASEQNRFWDFHDTLYANQITEDASLFTDARLIIMAGNLKLDMTAFNQCYQAKKYASVVKNDIAQGQSLKINGTPSIFVNGVLVSNFSNSVQEIDAALAGK